MKINFLNKFPNCYQPYGSLSELDEYDLRDLEELNLDEIWYWYSTAPYEGSGQMIMRRGNLYDIHDMGHCSCYGACERATFTGKSLNNIETSLSSEYLKEYIELIEMAKKS